MAVLPSLLAAAFAVSFAAPLAFLTLAATPASTSAVIPAPLPTFPFILAMAPAPTLIPAFAPASSLANALLPVFASTLLLASAPHALPCLSPLLTPTPAPALFLAVAPALCFLIAVMENDLRFILALVSGFLCTPAAAPTFILFTWSPAFLFLASATALAPTMTLASGTGHRPGSAKATDSSALALQGFEQSVQRMGGNRKTKCSCSKFHMILLTEVGAPSSPKKKTYLDLDLLLERLLLALRLLLLWECLLRERDLQHKEPASC